MRDMIERAPTVDRVKVAMALRVMAVRGQRLAMGSLLFYVVS